MKGWRFLVGWLEGGLRGRGMSRLKIERGMKKRMR